MYKMSGVTMLLWYVVLVVVVVGAAIAFSPLRGRDLSAAAAGQLGFSSLFVPFFFFLLPFLRCCSSVVVAGVWSWFFCCVYVSSL
jgi:hypothetical protein